MKLKFFTASEPSSTHPNQNEDEIFIEEKNKVAGLFDGLGGLAYGGEAATSAAEFCKVETSQQNIEKTLENCHKFLKEKARREFGKDIATTGMIVQIYTKQKLVLVVWGSVGDSRLYHFSEGHLLQKSSDDSLITQAQERGWIGSEKAERINQAMDFKGLNKVEKNLFNGRNMITQAIGIGEMKPRIGKFKAKEGDAIILTSDGVHDNLTNAQMEQILNQKPTDPAKKLVEEATFVSDGASIRAKQDDMTALVIELSP
jgi:protein phosphatase